MCLPTLCVCIVPGLRLLCEARAGVLAHCSCVCAPRALAESIVRDAWGCACPFVHANLFVSCLGWVYSVRLAGMCQPALRVCVCLVSGLSLLCETRGDVPAHLCMRVCSSRAWVGFTLCDSRGCASPPCVCVCLVPGLSLLCETRGDVPAPCSCVFVPRALAESTVRDSWECACPLCVCASCPGCVYCARLVRVCRPTVRACVRLVPWLSLL